jgi:hypothetical protein
MPRSPITCRYEHHMTLRDATTFAAGRDAGAHVAACLARLTAIQLVEDAHWWNRWRRRLMARTLITYAAEIDEASDDRPTEMDATTTAL